PSPIFSALLNEASPSKNHLHSVHFFIEASRIFRGLALPRIGLCKKFLAAGMAKHWNFRK
ncbi:MAG: hypothetical protein IJW12_00345, partial [Opitutales bacterium]|nr:hypothetical protein [Opitutales bacterium]